MENFDWCMANCQIVVEDHNLPRLSLWVARRWLEEIARKFNVDPKYVYELDPYLQRIRLVKHGDIILPEDHNSIVEALRKLRDVLEKIEGLVYKEGYEEGYEKGYEEGIAYCLEKLVPVPPPLPPPAPWYLEGDLTVEPQSEIVVGANMPLEDKVELYSEVAIYKS